MKDVWCVYKELVQIQLNEDYIRNNSVECDSPFELNNFDEQKVAEECCNVTMCEHLHPEMMSLNALRQFL